ncbi:importin-4-like [Stylophora pistillata]|uniref:importin-4-like n=1 Tax=Stylophora pistillata TaxID=50429 RepID=UPI000C04CADE|nr:importin-4-like [Stylophora pistillata]
MAELEEILEKLLVPDNAVIRQATSQLREAFENPAFVPALITVLGASQNPQVRQYAAVLLRRRVVKQWTKLSPEVHSMLRESLLQVLLQESDSTVRNSAAQVVSVIAKHDLPANQWPKLLVFLQQHIKSEQPQQREMGMFLLSSITESANEQLRPHFTSLFQLFSSTLEDQQSKLVPFYTIRALTYLIECIGSEEIPLVRPLIPKVVGYINQILAIDEDKACDAMEIFDELVESEVSIVTPHLKTLVEFCLQIASNPSYGNNLRIKALHFVSWLARIKPKALVKNKLLLPTLSVVFPLMASPPSEGDEEDFDDDDDDDEVGDETEASRPCAVASQVLDVLALHFPPESVIPPLMQLVQPALTSEDPYKRKAALIALAVLAEGCADYIRNRYLEAALQTICRGLSDQNTLVQNAALFALGQYSEYLQPDISKYSADILPLLFERLVNTSADSGQASPSISRTYYALETFCENLGEGILPYLPRLMEKLLVALSPSTSMQMKELAVSAIGATANAAKEAMLPYFPQIVEFIKEYLSNTESIERNILRVQAIDTLGVLARTIGASNFMPLADECVQLGLRLLEEDRDPDLRRCTYGLFASVSTILKSNMGKYLKDIVKYMIESLQSAEGIVTHYASEDDPSFLLEDEDLEGVGGVEDDDDEVTGYSVENAYLEEKEDTCNALGEISENSGTEFQPYLDESFKEVLKLIQFPHSGVRKGAVMALGQFCSGFHSLLQEAGAEDKTELQRMLGTAIPTFITVITKDKDRSVAMATLQSLNEVLKAVKSLIIDEQGHHDIIADAARTVLMQKTACQQDDDDDVEDSDQQAEFDAMLIEYAGDVLPSLATAVGGQIFAPYFAGFLPLLLKKTRKSCPVSDKSFAIGTISEVMLAMGHAIVPFVQHLFPVFMTSLKDEDDEVRSNAIYGLGIMAFYGGDLITPHYPTILEALFVILSQNQPPRVVDNICGAVSRMVMANRNFIPLEKVFPGLLQCLPLKEDFEENNPVYSCIIELFSDQHPLIRQYLPQLLAVFSQVLPSDTLQDGIRSGLVSVIQKIHQQSPQRFQNILAELPQEHAQVLMTAASMQAPG